MILSCKLTNEHDEPENEQYHDEHKFAHEKAIICFITFSINLIKNNNDLFCSWILSWLTSTNTRQSCENDIESPKSLSAAAVADIDHSWQHIVMRSQFSAVVQSADHNTQSSSTEMWATAWNQITRVMHRKRKPCMEIFNKKYNLRLPPEYLRSSSSSSQNVNNGTYC